MLRKLIGTEIRPLLIFTTYLQETSPPVEVDIYILYLPVLRKLVVYVIFLGLLMYVTDEDYPPLYSWGSKVKSSR